MIKNNPMSVRRLSFALVCTGLGAFGCATETADEQVGHSSAALIMQPTADRPLGTDTSYPVPACPATEASARTLHGKATTFFKYVLGGPTTKTILGETYSVLPAFTGGTTAQQTAAKQCLDDLRYLIVTSSQCTVSTLRSTTLSYDTNCGFRGVARRMTCDGSFVTADAKTCRDNLDASWGKGVGAFFLPFKNSGANTFYIDPEPVRLTADLSATSGASAAGVYVDSATSTAVSNWPDTFTTARYPIAVGTPCSNNPLATDSETELTIFSGGGSYRACL